MLRVTLHKGGRIHSAEVSENANLVVNAGIKRFPYPHLRYGCGMGKCGKCACQVISGGKDLPPPSWKEQNRLGDKIDQGYRLMCQLWLTADIEIRQDVEVGAAAATVRSSGDR